MARFQYGEGRRCHTDGRGYL